MPMKEPSGKYKCLSNIGPEDEIFVIYTTYEFVLDLLELWAEKREESLKKESAKGKLSRVVQFWTQEKIFDARERAKELRENLARENLAKIKD